MSNIINLGNGGSGSLKGNALETDVVSGKTFFSDKTEIKTGSAENIAGLLPYDLNATPPRYKLVDDSTSSYKFRNFKINSISSDLTTWIDICYGNGMFVAISSTNGLESIMTSSDGIVWTTRTSVSSIWRSIYYENGLFVVIGGSNTIMTSSDGILWTQRTSPKSYDWGAICYGNGLFVVVSDTGSTDRIITSPDGITWTVRATPSDCYWLVFNSIVYGNNMFVAVSDYYYTGYGIMTSPDGITWTARITPINTSWNSVCYGNGLFVALSSAGNLMTSPDGITWTSHTINYIIEIQKIKFINGMFIAVAYSGTQRVIYSYDGINWYSVIDKSTLHSLTSLEFANNILVFTQSSESI